MAAYSRVSASAKNARKNGAVPKKKARGGRKREAGESARAKEKANATPTASRAKGGKAAARAARPATASEPLDSSGVSEPTGASSPADTGSPAGSNAAGGSGVPGRQPPAPAAEQDGAPTPAATRGEATPTGGQPNDATVRQADSATADTSDPETSDPETGRPEASDANSAESKSTGPDSHDTKPARAETTDAESHPCAENPHPDDATDPGHAPDPDATSETDGAPNAHTADTANTADGTADAGATDDARNPDDTEDARGTSGTDDAKPTGSTGDADDADGCGHSDNLSEASDSSDAATSSDPENPSEPSNAPDTNEARRTREADETGKTDEADETGEAAKGGDAAGAPLARPTEQTPAPRYDYDRYSQLAGPLTEPPADAPYRVRYRSLLAQEPHRVRAALLLAAAPTVSAILLVWLLRPEHWVHREYVSGWETAADTVMLVAIGLIEVFRLFTVVSNAHATLVARDPIPVHAAPGTRVAFLTSFVPGKEPVAMVRATLEAATRLRHPGLVDVWLLDEGDDAEIKELCAKLGVRHFSRKGVARWNQPTGAFRAKTKHGNYNSWLDAHGDAYEFMACVDTDHVPLPNFLERMLGYFRDPDVAFVVGPQVYGNYDAAVTKAAESQQFLFHALIQRAGNAYDGAMFVGTNNAVRISALKSIGGLYDSITEDMATGFELHRTRNPETGNKWRSVYTPDVLAVGEGPTAWTDFFTQQLRWSRGTYETVLKQYWRGIPTLPPGKLLNYSLLVTFYPMSALNWMLSALSCTLFLGLGASGIQISSEIWLMLYSDAAALQIGLYIWNRKHNVSPHEPSGSSGTAGMALSAISAPIYAKSLCDAVLRRKSRFVVTPKGDSSSPDRLATFRIHLLWAVVFGGSLLAAPFLGHTHMAMCVWAFLAVLLCLATPALWYGGLLRERHAARPAIATLPAARVDSPTPPSPTSAPTPTTEAPQTTTTATAQDAATADVTTADKDSLCAT
nr:glycosyltransferase family 2 protein [Streptomyces buecherae]